MFSSIFQHVSLIAHADWSKNPAKRWAALAVRLPYQRWLVSELDNVTDPSQYLSHLKSQPSQPGCILAGFDFPIGIPAEYARKTGITHFLTALTSFGHGSWREFYLPADSPNQVSLYRPFYPSRPGNSKRSYLEKGLGIPFKHLFRLCEVAHVNRRAACPLFWTMGGQQVGKAAISGWQTLLAPALNEPDLNLHIWPFSGPLKNLLIPGHIVAVETYPAEFYGHLGLSFSTPVRRSKRRQADRIALSHPLLSWAQNHQVDLPVPIAAKILDGYGNRPDGEDQFDALVGLYGMINIVQGKHTYGEPRSEVITTIEGWIFGQEAPKQDM